MEGWAERRAFARSVIRDYRFDEGLTLRAVGWPASSGRRAVAVLSPNPISLRRVGSPCEDCPECDRVSPSTLRHRSMSRCRRGPFQTRSRSIRSRRRKVAGQASPPCDETGLEYARFGGGMGEGGHKPASDWIRYEWTSVIVMAERVSPPLHGEGRRRGAQPGWGRVKPCARPYGPTLIAARSSLPMKGRERRLWDFRASSTLPVVRSVRPAATTGPRTSASASVRPDRRRVRR